MFPTELVSLRDVMARALHFVAIATRGIEEALAEELRGLGMRQIKPQRGAVEFQGRLRDGYRAVLWSRLASRILLRLGRSEARNAAELYEGARQVVWEDHIDRNRTLAVSFVGKSPEIRDTRFGALKVKDAIVDRLRDHLVECVAAAQRVQRAAVDPHREALDH